MKWLNQTEVKNYLMKNGLAQRSLVVDVLSGFDLSQPIYEQLLEEGDEIFQFIRRSSAGDMSPRVGSWFALPGATTQSVAIIDGGAGRRLHRFRVVRAFLALEGAARNFPLNWKLGIGGKGGGTQLYVPPRYLGHLDAVAPA